MMTIKGPHDEEIKMDIDGAIKYLYEMAPFMHALMYANAEGEEGIEFMAHLDKPRFPYLSVIFPDFFMEYIVKIIDDQGLKFLGTGEKYSTYVREGGPYDNLHGND